MASIHLLHPKLSPRSSLSQRNRRYPRYPARDYGPREDIAKVVGRKYLAKALQEVAEKVML